MQPEDVFYLARKRVELSSLYDHLPDVSEFALKKVSEVQQKNQMQQNYQVEKVDEDSHAGYKLVNRNLIKCELRLSHFIQCVYMANQLVSEVTNPATVSNFNISNNLVQALSFDKDLRNTLVHKGFLGLIIKKGYVVIDVEYIRDVVYKYDTQDNSSPEFQTEGIYEFSRDEYIPVKWYIKRSMRLALDMILSIIEQIENKVRDLGREQEFELYKSVYPINSRPGSVK